MFTVLVSRHFNELVTTLSRQPSVVKYVVSKVSHCCNLHCV